MTNTDQLLTLQTITMHLKQDQEQPQQEPRQPPRHPSAVMVEEMRDSPALLAGTRILLQAMHESYEGMGPIWEGTLTLMTVWSEAIRLSADPEEAVEVVKAALRRNLHVWDFQSGWNSRARILRLVRENMEEIKKEREESRNSDSD